MLGDQILFAIDKAVHTVSLVDISIPMDPRVVIKVDEKIENIVIFELNCNVCGIRRHYFVIPWLSCLCVIVV